MITVAAYDQMMAQQARSDEERAFLELARLAKAKRDLEMYRAAESYLKERLNEERARRRDEDEEQ